MGAGAYAFDINPLGDSVNPNVPIRRILPLVPAQDSGIVKYGRVFVTLFAPVQVAVNVTVVIAGAADEVLAPVNADRGGTEIPREVQPHDKALDISFLTTNTAKIVTALVEFGTQ